MATLALTAIGSTIGGGSGTVIATAVGSVIGGYIDSTVILPRLFKEKGNGELGSSTIQTVDEGAPFRYAIGPETRVPGFLAWQPSTLEYVPGDPGGKGGGSSKTPTQEKYYSSGHWLFTRVPEGHRGITGIRQLWMDSKLRYDTERPTLEFASDRYEIVETVTYGPLQWRTSISGPPVLDRQAYLFYEVIGIDIDPTGSPYAEFYYLDDMVVGQQFRLTNCADERLDGDHQLLAAGRTSNGRPYARFQWTSFQYGYQYGIGGLWESDIVSGNFILPGDLNPAHDQNGFLSLYQSLSVFDQGLANSFTARPGTREHSQITTITDVETLSPKFHSFSSMTINRLALQDFGNRLPNLEALVSSDTNPVPLAEALTRIFTLYLGVSEDDFDFSGIPSDVLLRGYWWEAPYDGKTLLQPLLLAYDLIWYEAEGKLYIKQRNLIDEVTVPEGDLGIRQDNRNVDIPTIDFADNSELRVTKEVSVRYTDPLSAYQIGDMVYRRPDIEIGETVSIDLTRLTITSDEARAIAQRMVWHSAMYRLQAEFTLGPNWLGITAGTIVNTTAQGKAWRIMLTEVTRGDDGRMRCQGYVDDGLLEELKLLPTDLSGATGGANGFFVPPDAVLIPMKMPDLYASASSGTNGGNTNTVGIYFAACAFSPGADWRGAIIYERYPADPSNENFVEISRVTQQSFVGRLITDIPDGIPDVLCRYADPIQIEMFNGELVTVTVDQLMRGENLLFIDEEVIGFESASLESNIPGFDNGGVFELDGQFIRGLWGTEDKISAHTAGSLVVLIDPSRLIFRELSHVQGNQAFGYKLVPTGADLDDVEETAVPQMTFETVRCWEPSHVRGKVDPFADQQQRDWDVNEDYLVFDYVRHNGSGAWLVYQAQADSGPAVFGPIAEDNVEPGAEPLWQGAPTSYIIDDKVTYDLNKESLRTYIAIQPSTGVIPGVTAGWDSSWAEIWREVTLDPIVIEWNRRTRYQIPILPRNRPESSEATNRYMLRIRRGTTTAATVVFNTELSFFPSEATKYVYGFAERSDPSTGNNLDSFLVEVRHNGGFQNSAIIEQIVPGP